MLVSVEAQEVVLLIYDLLCAFLYAYLTATLIACGLFFSNLHVHRQILYASIVDIKIFGS